MKLRLIASQTTVSKEPRVKPVDHFKKCPACGCKELIEVNPDVLCSRCDWDSTAWDVSRGGVDNLFSAAKEFGFPVMQSITGDQSPKPIEINQPKPTEEGA